MWQLEPPIAKRGALIHIPGGNLTENNDVLDVDADSSEP